MDAKDGPDKYSNEWYRQRLGLLRHHQERLEVENLDLSEKVNELSGRVGQMEAARLEDMAKIGELIGRLDQAAREFANLSRKFDELKSNGKKAVA